MVLRKHSCGGGAYEMKGQTSIESSRLTGKRTREVHPCPTVSVIVPTHNMGHFLGSALQSVLSQSYRDFEIIVVDDGSTDNTSEVLARYSLDAIIRCLHQENRGPSAARNAGIKAARGRYIAFLDADDMWLPGKLDRQVAAMRQHPEATVVYCRFRYMDLHGNLLPCSTDWVLERTRETLYEELMYRNVISGSDSAVLVRSSHLMEVGLFDEYLPTCEDQDLWRRLALRHQFCFLEDEVLVYIRRHPGSIQANLRQTTLGRMRYLSKLRRDTPPEFRHHLPNVAQKAYLELAWAHYAKRRFSKSLFFLAKIALLGPTHCTTLLRDIGLMLWHRWRRRHPHEEVEK